MTPEEFIGIHNKLRKQYPTAPAYKEPECQELMFYSLSKMPGEAVAAAVDDWVSKYPKIAPSMSFVKRLSEIYARNQTLVVIPGGAKNE